MVQVLQQHISLTHNVVLLVALEDHLLVEYFNGVDGVLFLVSSREDLTEAALADGAQELKVTRLDAGLLRGAEVDHLLAAVGGDGHR